MYIAAIVDRIAPRRCGGCGQVNVTVTRDPVCARCVVHLATVPPVTEGRWGRWSAFEYRDQVRGLIQQAKFHPGGERGLRWLAQAAAMRLAKADIARPEAVVAVPLGRRRLVQRGFNQAEVVAEMLANSQSVPLLDGLARVRETKPQVGLDRGGRRRNMDGVFQWTGAKPPPAHLWLVDDVITTGATTLAAKAALMAAGAPRIQVISLAREI